MAIETMLARPPTRRSIMPRTINAWPRTYSWANLRSVLAARRAGATVSLNHVKLCESTVESNALVMEYALLWLTSVGRYTIVGRYTSLFNTDVAPLARTAHDARLSRQLRVRLL
jgi:hypothetical protein